MVLGQFDKARDFMLPCFFEAWDLLWVMKVDAFLRSRLDLEATSVEVRSA